MQHCWGLRRVLALCLHRERPEVVADLVWLIASYHCPLASVWRICNATHEAGDILVFRYNTDLHCSLSVWFMPTSNGWFHFEYEQLATNDAWGEQLLAKGSGKWK
eukprot:TRINITY_DN12612_c0_g2_i3.p2 TRINITY_DN12612_c0_g2~~TRINITY_DN12612_c0_g2_i3.p2  ORF type:complete len:115 (+),score=13.42 TRINITY_DN12612_c0_g2_i3:31-345(+)